MAGLLLALTAAGYPYPFLDPTLPFERRAADLAGRLTLEEKAAHLGHWDFGSDQSIGRANSPPIPRLRVKGYNYGTECNSGIIVGYPQNINMAATFNRTTVFLAGKGTGLGLRAQAIDCAKQTGPNCNNQKYPPGSCWSPMINLMRHPMWGRNHEGYGEDPFLAGELAHQIITGMQGDHPRYAIINAGVKHFAAFDGPLNGGEANISDADWVQTYLAPFSKAFKAGALSTMCTYAKLNGVWGCNNPKALQQWLRERMGFKGYVISDQGALHDPADSIRAGCDMEDGGGGYKQLVELVQDGLLNESAVTQAVARVFYARMRTGEFDPPEDVPWEANSSAYSSAAYPEAFFQNVSLEATRQSLTLLKNDGALPLNLTRRLQSTSGDFKPCDGNTTGGQCGIAANKGFCCENLGAVAADTADSCCTACRNKTSCVAWTLTGNTSSCQQRSSTNHCLCWLHNSISGSNRIQLNPGFTAGVVYDRLPPFPPCSQAPSTKVAVLGIEWFVGAGYDTAPAAHPTFSEVLSSRGLNVSYAQGCAHSPVCAEYDGVAVQAALADAKVAVVFIGRGGVDGEGRDSANMSLFGHQRQLIDDAVASRAKIVLVLLTVNPQDLEFAVQNPAIAAILWVGYPQNWGGEAIADVLLGVVSPAGRMPYTWPKDLSLAGDIGNYTMAGKTYRYRSAAATAANTLWSFGYGLSYTHFRYDTASVIPTTIKPCENVTVLVNVSNTGLVDSDEVVQVYASWRLDAGHNTSGIVSTPARQLVGFERVFIAAGATVEVAVRIPPGTMAVLNSTGSYEPEPPSPPPPGPPRPPFIPCDGTVSRGTCGLLNETDFNTPDSTGVPASTLEECCNLCRAANGSHSVGHACIAWTLTWCHSGNCTCWMHRSIDGYAPGSSGANSGVVYDRLPPFPACPKPVPPPPPTPLPVWTVVPATVALSVGGQQPQQPISAPSNVLLSSFSITGEPVPLDKC